MQNKYLINFSKKFWFWFWTKLMNGFAPSDLQGNYRRPRGILINKNYEFKVKNENSYLLVGNSCPWCHRTLLIYKLKNLSKKVKVIFLEADINSGQWIFKKKFEECETLHQFYKKAQKHNLFRATLPLLFNFQNDQINILSNESSEIVKFLNSIKVDSSQKTLQIRKCDQDLLEIIHSDINNGVYKCGFARNQISYEKASKNLFEALTIIEKKFDKNVGNWICGEDLTYADIYLFPTIIRWELIYRQLFKCTEKEISDFRNIIKWRLRFFKLTKVSETCFDSEWKKDYYKALFPLNPNQIIPVLPSLKEIMQSLPK
ncbi:Glutathione S-transferase C terminus [Prochlorococcus marinus subsp. pastoris str. CCMP1986]|uniref:Glutathione S-transferase C terminus n=2 Tax=Prochlorococcaceae TaxID=2881426 RepID=Q7V366_PROMP|nr:glutathione S-transferase family protein [Prochlorococcus marinus]KGF88027.1 Glutathione S-transferase [Prochlorococcus marinus str. EQPAC1]CAE18680.1 Glutathione S-transferase C terminus [Prochlorococcus marinus subsp. pastoris str. CCMP1986]